MGTFVDPQVELAFGVQPLSTVASSQWTDVTTDARRPLTIRRGRSRQLDRPNSGSMSVKLDNRQRNYDPDNTTGPHAGDVIPDVPVRVSAVHAGTTYRLFRGSVNGWPQRWSEGGDFDAWVPLAANDGFKFLSLPQIGTPYDDAVLGTSGLVGYWKLDESSGTTAVDSSTNSNDGTVTNSSLVTQGSTGAFVGGGRTAYTFTTSTGFVDLGSSTTLNPSQHSLEAWYNTTHSTAGGQGLDIYRWRLFGHQLGLTSPSSGWSLIGRVWTSTAGVVAVSSTRATNDGEWHHAVLTFDGDNVVLWEDGQEVDRARFVGDGHFGSGSASIGREGDFDASYFAGRIDEVALYDRALTQQEIAKHFNQKVDSFSTERSDQRVGRVLDFAGWSTSTAARELRQGQTNLSADDADDSRALDYIQRVAQSENGVFLIDGQGQAVFRDRHYRLTQQTTPVATFGDLSSELPYSQLEIGVDDDDLSNVVTVSRDGGSTATVFSTGSIDDHGRRLLERSNLLMADDNETQSAAEWLLTRFADPETRVRSITLKAHGSTELWPEVLGREVGDHIVVKRRPPAGGSTVTKSLHIEGIEHRVTEQTWETRFECSNVDQTGYLIWDSTVRAQWDEERWGY